MCQALSTVRVVADEANRANSPQAVFIDGQDGNELRRQGTAPLLEQIAANLPD